MDSHSIPTKSLIACIQKNKKEMVTLDNMFYATYCSIKRKGKNVSN